MGDRAANSVIGAFEKNDFSGEQLGSWCEEFKAGSQWIRKLVEAFYSKEFSFGKFMAEHPEYKGNLVDILIGRVFHSEAGNIFESMDPAMAAAVDMQ